MTILDRIHKLFTGYMCEEARNPYRLMIGIEYFRMLCAEIGPMSNIHWEMTKTGTIHGIPFYVIRSNAGAHILNVE